MSESNYDIFHTSLIERYPCLCIHAANLDVPLQCSTGPLQPVPGAARLAAEPVDPATNLDVPQECSMESLPPVPDIAGQISTDGEAVVDHADIRLQSSQHSSWRVTYDTSERSQASASHASGDITDNSTAEELRSLHHSIPPATLYGAEA